MASAFDLSIIKRLGQHLPSDMTNRFRVLILLLAISSTLTTWPIVLAASGTALPLRFLQIALMSAIFWLWTRWYRSGSIRRSDLILELSAVFTIAYLVGVAPIVLTFVYTGVYFRPLFTNNRETAIASAGYVLVYLAGMAAAAIQSDGDFGPHTVVQGVSLLLGAAIVRTIAIIMERSASVTRELEQTERQYRTLVEQLPGIVITLDLDGAANYVSPRIHDILGYSPDEYIGIVKDRFRIVHEDDKRHVFGTMERCLKSREPIEFECRVTHANGEIRWIKFEADIFESGTEHIDEWRGIITDITDQQQLAEKLEHQAFHDALTDLPNRALFEARLKHTIDMQFRRTSLNAVLFLDLDNFKFVNDSLGHSAGDDLLIVAAERIQGCLRSGDTVARLGGDEFAMLLEDLQNRDEALRIAERIGDQLALPFQVNGYPAYVSASIGIAFNQSGSRLPEDLVRQADVAMYEAKRTGKARYIVFEHVMEKRAWERLEREGELRGAMERQEFQVCYQPVVDLSTGAIQELEALVRWNHPTRGNLTPDEFLPLAEEISMMPSLDLWVMEQACRNARRWQEGYPAHASLVISVNVSPGLLREPELTENVADILRQTGLAPDRLKLEVSENTMLDDIEHAVDVISSLNKLGVQIAIDDFGTGSSALSYLRYLPIGTLKIDRSYVAGIDTSPGGLQMMTAIVNLAGSLGYAVTAEGIEHRHQTHLRGLGCDLGQGSYFARPVPPDQVETLLGADTAFAHHLDLDDQYPIATSLPALPLTTWD